MGLVGVSQANVESKLPGGPWDLLKASLALRAAKEFARAWAAVGFVRLGNAVGLASTACPLRTFSRQQG